MGEAFISHTSDMAEYPRSRSFVRAAIDAVMRAGHRPVDMSLFPAGSEAPEEYCRRRVRQCGIYVGVIGFRYGSLLPAGGMSYTELEFTVATEAGLPRLLFILDEEAPVPASLVDRDQSDVLAFRNRILNAGIIVTRFTSAEDLDGRVYYALHSIATDLADHAKTAGSGTPADEEPPSQILQRYRERFTRRYRRLDLEVLTPNDHEEQAPMMLRSVFIPPGVRSDAPPLELSKELWRRLIDDGELDSGELPEGFDADQLTKERASYRKRPTRPVLDVLGDPAIRRTVILGDPGAGKSTLARFLALSLIAEQVPDQLRRLAGQLPFLIELRAYASLRGEQPSFLDYIDYLYRSESLGLPLAQLEELLSSDGRAVVIFDGLDEIFEPHERETVSQQISAFATRFPRVRILVTSRVIGYRRAPLADAEFMHFTLQDLSTPEIRTFIDRWYSLALPDNQGEARRRRDRLSHAIDDSASIRELAGNPLLLTVLAIIGRRQELPRERRAVYAHAAAVLVDRWDVNRYLTDSSVETGYLDMEDKKELLRRVARRMQSGRSGIAGNHIRGADLIVEFSRYLRDRYGLDEPSVKRAASAMLAQFRERNFILTLYGGEVYGFVHRAFLEYFCADEIVQRFQRKREFSPDDLVYKIVGRRWPDPSWQEVLLLVSSMVDDRFTARVVDYLVREAKPVWSLTAWDHSAIVGGRAEAELPRNLLLAAHCIAEIRNSSAVAQSARGLTAILLTALDWTARAAGDSFGASSVLADFVNDEIVPVLAAVGIRWPGRFEFLSWQRSGSLDNVRSGGVLRILASMFVDDHRIRRDVFSAARHAPGWNVREKAVQAAAQAWSGHPDLHALLLSDRVLQDDDEDVVLAVLQGLRDGWPDDLSTRELHLRLAEHHPDGRVRSGALSALLEIWPDAPDIRELLYRLAESEDADVREEAIDALIGRRPGDPELRALLHEHARSDPGRSVRQTIVESLDRLFPGDGASIQIMVAAVEHDPQPQVREAALRALAASPSAATTFRQTAVRSARQDAAPQVRVAAIDTLADAFAATDPEVSRLVHDVATDDCFHEVRETAVRALAGMWTADTGEFGLLAAIVTDDGSPAVRTAAIGELTALWPDDPRTAQLLRETAAHEENHDVWSTALDAFTDESNTARIAPLVVDHASRLLTAGLTEIPYRATRAALADFLTDHLGKPDLVQQVLERLPPTELEEAFVDAVLDHETSTTDRLNEVVARSLPSMTAAAARTRMVRFLDANSAGSPAVLRVLLAAAETDPAARVRRTALEAVCRIWRADPAARELARSRAIRDRDPGIRMVALQALVLAMSEGDEVLDWLRWRAIVDEDWDVRRAAIRLAARVWGDRLEVVAWLCHRASADENYYVREAAIAAVASKHRLHPHLGERLRTWAAGHEERWGRHFAVSALVRDSPEEDDEQTLDWLRQSVQAGNQYLVRQEIVGELGLYRTHLPGVRQLLLDRAVVDSEPEVRRTAVERLARAWPDDPETAALLRSIAVCDAAVSVRTAAVELIAKTGWADPATMAWLAQLAVDHVDAEARSWAINGVTTARWAARDAGLADWLTERATRDKAPSVRVRAIELLDTLAPGDVRERLRDLVDDPHWRVRAEAIDALADGRDGQEHLDWLRLRFREEPDHQVRRVLLTKIDDVSADTETTRRLLRDTAAAGYDDRSVRLVALEKLGDQAAHRAEIRAFLCDLARHDSDPALRQRAVEVCAEKAGEIRSLHPWLCTVAETDQDPDVRLAALTAMAESPYAPVGTMQWVLRRAAQDEDEDLRVDAYDLLVEKWPGHPEVAMFLRLRAEEDPSPPARRAALESVLGGTRADDELFAWLRQRAVLDPSDKVRAAAVTEAAHHGDDDDAVAWLRTCAVQDPADTVRRVALMAVTRRWPHDDLVGWLMSRAADDRNAELRGDTVQMIARGWGLRQDVRDWLEDLALRDDRTLAQAATSALELLAQP